MKNHFNKVLPFAFIAILVICIITVSCKKYVYESDNVIPSNQILIIHASDKIDLRTSDVNNENDQFSRKIEVINRATKLVNDTYIIKVKSIDNKSDIYTSIKNRIFSGYMTIESDNYELLKIESKNGHLVKKVEYNPYASQKPLYAMEELPNTCKINLIHNCVRKKIDDMNFWAYATCLIYAPECYGGLWAECSFLFCVVGEQNRTSM